MFLRRLFVRDAAYKGVLLGETNDHYIQENVISAGEILSQFTAETVNSLFIARIVGGQTVGMVSSTVWIMISQDHF